MKKILPGSTLPNHFLFFFGLVIFLLLSLFISRKSQNQIGYTKPPEKESLKKMFGVTMAGGEFGQQTLPGTINKDYIYPSSREEYAYFADFGLTLIRLPIRWERVQDTKFGKLRDNDIQKIKLAIDAARQNKQRVIIDLHNFGYYYNVPLTTKDKQVFADVWIKLAKEFQNDRTVLGYELMNEPHDLPEGVTGWQQLAQEAVNAIREVDRSHIIFVPGYDWQSAYRWRSSNESLSITDPENNLVFAAHEYFDDDHSGTYKKSYDADGAYPEIGTDRLQPFESWLHDHKQRGIITEYGIPDHDERWLVILDNFLRTIQKDSNLIGGIYWAAGPWYGDYPLSIDPLKSQNSPQMTILLKYKSDQ